MKLTKNNSWHYKFWKLNYAGWFGNDEPNENFCDYFWALVWATLMLPITWIGLIYKGISGETGAFGRNIVNTLMAYAVLSLAGVFIGTTVKHGFWAILGPLLIILAVSVVILLIVYYFKEVFPQSSVSRNLSETSDIIGEGWKSFKGKYCPKIDWQVKE